MFLSRLSDPDYCVAQAQIARKHADLRKNQATKAALIKIADGYLRIAKSGKTRVKTQEHATQTMRAR